MENKDPNNKPKRKPIDILAGPELEAELAKLEAEEGNAPKAEIVLTTGQERKSRKQKAKAISKNDPVLLPAQGDIWEKLPGEPELWYKRFQIYYELGAARSIGKAFKLCVENDVAIAKLESLHTWRHHSLKWRWHERAIAWEIQLYDDFLKTRREKATKCRDDLLDSTYEAGKLYNELIKKRDIATLKALAPFLITLYGKRGVVAGLLGSHKTLFGEHHHITLEERSADVKFKFLDIK